MSAGQPIQMHHADCFAFMQTMEDASVDMVLTDPPYGIRYKNGYAHQPYQPLQGDSGIDYALFAQECYRVLRPDSHAYFFTRFDVYPYHFQCLSQAGFTIKNCMVIEKGNVGGLGDLQGSYANNCEWVIFCQKGRRRFNKTKLLKNMGPLFHKAARPGLTTAEYKTRLNCCWFGEEYPCATPNANWKTKHGCFHPTVKDVRCLEWFIQISCAPQGIVFDPFMGSGSTAVAARNTGRRFIGCEIALAYFDLSRKRLQEVNL